METISKTSRRDFLKLGLTAGSGLMLSFNLSDSLAAIANVSDETLAAANVDFNSYLSISPDDVVTIFHQIQSWAKTSKRPSRWWWPKNWMPIGKK